MRPTKLVDFVGQEAVVGKDSVFRKSIETDSLRSVILWGPPGSGKTTLAMIISNETKAHFVHKSAVACGSADIRRIDKEASERLATTGVKTILLLDEVHRFNKAQQDMLLPSVEDGRVILIGATTENPYHEINSALLSRSLILRLEPLEEEQLMTILRRALSERELGLGSLDFEVSDEALEYIASKSNGDARIALNALEMAVIAVLGEEKGNRRVTVREAEDALQKKALLYDRAGDFHYDIISAFIKSMRGSDPDAAVYWLARMIAGGEDPKFIARRMIIFASEDVGNADPHALLVASSAAHAVEFVGLPECKINLSQAATYLAAAPKSNSAYLAITEAEKDVEEERTDQPPVDLRDSHYPGAKKLGHGKGYKYPHAYPEHYVKQQYLPDNLKGRVYYRPSDQGYEKRIAERLKDWRKKH